jgi:cytochrome c-type biogenesis protein CcmH/NrfG
MVRFHTRFAYAMGLICAVLLSATAPVLAHTHADDLRAQGHEALAQKHYDRAIKAFQRSVVANPKSPAGYIGLAKAEMARQQWARSAKFFAIALEIDPIDRAALVGDGLLALSTGDKDRARARLDRLQMVCPTCAETASLSTALTKQN